MPNLLLLQPNSQTTVIAIHLIRREPLEGNAGLQCAFNHLPRQFWLRGKADGIGYLGCQALLLVICPILGQIEFAVDQKPSLVADIGEKHADLAVFDPACSAAVLPRHADRMGAFL